MPYTVFIDGAEGTTGLQIHQRLAGDADITLLTLAEADRKLLPKRIKAAQSADVSILCLPDAAAAELAVELPAGVKLCDASTAHRTKPGWAYGFAELAGAREKIITGNRTAVPGCHATGFLALAAPLVHSGILPAAAQLYCHSLTGYSGGGKKMIAAYEAGDRSPLLAAPRPYALGLAHKHLPEMQAHAGLATPPLFCPVVDDYYSGMLVSLPLFPAQLKAGYGKPIELKKVYEEYYAGEPLIHIKTDADLPPDGTLPANALAGRDDMELYILGNEEQLLLCARFDNLGKGAAGAALQCLNLMLGRPETAGLRLL